ncbi:hypothetical protein [Faecalicoccus pleomorphus]|uniref:hypothetical protein n=1 Tax=Faecalicoccus pleomorphus TaxID=1323 RepID=UPI00242AA540|nr:hypothetical protein [Faecalicoccus pleomorphus]
MAKLKVLVLGACSCIVLGLLFCAFVSFSHQDTDFESNQWYQSVHTDENGDLFVRIQLGNIIITQLG